MIRGFLSRLFLPEAQPQPRLGSTGELAKPSGTVITAYPVKYVPDEPTVLLQVKPVEEAPDIITQTVRRWLSAF